MTDSRPILALAAAAAIAAFVAFPFVADWWSGVGCWGPEAIVTFTVRSKEGSVVDTNLGTFECVNGLWLGVNNAEVLLGHLTPGRTYRVKVRGNRVRGRSPFIVHILNETTQWQTTASGRLLAQRHAAGSFSLSDYCSA